MLHGIDIDLFRKHNRPGPRYTSYPTVPAWRDDFGPGDFASHLERAAAMPADKPLSLYVHLPFCESMCRYCGCNVVISRSFTRHAEYVEVLDLELGMIAERLGARNKLMQLHYGGGTPTFLEEPLLVKLWESIHTRFEILDGAEMAIEADPAVTTNKKLAVLRGMGFNRLSIGVQDFDQKVLDAVARPQTVEQVSGLYRYARKIGFSGINFDLMYGLPHQTAETFGSTIQRVIELGPDRIAVFSYAHLPHLKPHQRQLDESAMLGGEEKYELFASAREMLLDAGYLAIGMDHFAREDDVLAIARRNGKLSRNFQGYTDHPTDDIVAVGISAISSLETAYAQNVRPLNGYYRAIREGELATCKGIEVSDDDRIRRAAINEMMCQFGLDLDDFGARHGIDGPRYFHRAVAQLGSFVEDEIVSIDGSTIRVTEQGWPFIRNVAMAFDVYLEEVQQNSERPAFSRTI
ncbi:MAG: oxygen-independent coproporphyrinogen III oxidase [Myxococcales bacterium]|nr:oxygen-independent coproporphyrinogen III oxidase [Myxococcales bacterium]